MDPLRHVKPAVRALAPYTLAVREAPVKINQNENPWDLPKAVRRRVLRKALDRPWSRYPDFDPKDLLEALARFSGWRADGILAGNGSNEMIEALLLVTVGPGTRVVIPEPTFTLYALRTTILGGEAVRVALSSRGAPSRTGDEGSAFSAQIALRLDQQIAALEAAGLLGDKLFGKDYSLRIYTHLGAGAYICGEETAMLESLEGKLGQPRLRPPFPPSFRLFGKPTVVNNVETLTNIPMIISRGPDWYRSIGTAKSPGPKIFSLSGRVVRPGNYELPLGTTFRQLIFEHGGGIIDGRPVKAIMAAGASSALIVANDEALDTPMDYESVPKVGGSLGSASVIVIDDTDFEIRISAFVLLKAPRRCARPFGTLGG